MKISVTKALHHHSRNTCTVRHSIYRVVPGVLLLEESHGFRLVISPQLCGSLRKTKTWETFQPFIFRYSVATPEYFDQPENLHYNPNNLQPIFNFYQLTTIITDRDSNFETKHDIQKTRSNKVLEASIRSPVCWREIETNASCSQGAGLCFTVLLVNFVAATSFLAHVGPIDVRCGMSA